MTPVTDPSLLAQLNGPSGPKPVTDAALLAQLNGTSAPDVAEPASHPVGDFSSALGHHLVNFLHGGAQFIEHGIAKAADMVDPPHGTLVGQITGASGRTAANQWLQDTVAADDAGMKSREEQYQASTPNNVASYTGATMGEVLPFLLGGPSSLIKSGGDKVGAMVEQLLAKAGPKVANVGGKVASGAVQGGIVGATAPVTGGDYGSAKTGQIGAGAMFGGALPLAGVGANSVYQGVKNAIAPIVDPASTVAQAAQKWAGTNSQAMIDALRNSRQFVEGSTPTTAQLLADPSIVQAEKTIAGNPAFKPQFVERENANNLARVMSLNDVAGQPGALDSLTAARGKTANDMYQTAFTNGVDPAALTPWVKGQVTQLLKAPAVQKAMSDAKSIAANEGITLGDSNSIQGMHYAKMALDDQISAAVRAGNNVDARSLGMAKDRLLTVMDKMSPDYAAARVQYAADSAPINSMEAGTSIINKLSGGALNSSGVPQITLPGYKSALAAALKNADYGIEPEKKAALQAIQDDLQRSTISNSIKSPGSDTAFNLQAPNWLGRQLYGQDFSGPTGLGKILSGAAGAHFGGPAGFAGGYLGAGKLGGMASDRMNKALADALLHPEKFADLLDGTNAPGAAQKLLASPMIRALLEKSPQMTAYPVARQIGTTP